MTADSDLPPWTYVSALALCVDEADRVLLCRVGPGYAASGQWTLPGGGLDFGETPEAAVIRELHEETGLSGAIEAIAFVHSGTGAAGNDRARSYGPYHAIRIVYRVCITGGDLRDEADGSTDKAEWFERDAVVQLPLVDVARAALRHLDGA